MSGLFALGVERDAAAALALALVLAAPAFGQGATDARRTAIEQKIKLLDTMMGSPRVTQAETGTDTDAKNRITKSRQQLDSARKALQGNDLDQASESLDTALREVSLATTARLANTSSLTVSAERVRKTELTEQLESYRAALAGARKDPKAATAAGAALEKIDRLNSQAEQFAAAGKWSESNKVLGEAYLHAVSALSSITAGQTVVYALKFDTPADEYAYEIKRYQGHEILVDMMVQEGRAEGDKRKLVDRYLAEARRLRGQADAEAKASDHKTAVKTIEQATQQLVRALQAVGMAVF